jgi:hypothetical protein
MLLLEKLLRWSPPLLLLLAYANAAKGLSMHAARG